MRLLNPEERAGVRDGGRNFLPIAHDRGVHAQLREFALRVPADLCGVEAIERLAEGLPLVQDDRPAEPRLKGIQDQRFSAGSASPAARSATGNTDIHGSWARQPPPPAVASTG